MNWNASILLAQLKSGNGGGVITLIAGFVIVLIILGAIAFVVKRYKRCPSNRILVVYGKVGGSRAARAMHGGGVFVLPVIQDYAYLCSNR